MRGSNQSRALSWIQTYQNQSYFFTDNGESWTPIGQNDSITWPGLRGIFMRKDIDSAERYFRTLSEHGVNCMRLMLEYCQGENRYLERPVGYFQPNMIDLWDAMFALAEKYNIRFLITPFDTYWMKRRWKLHPYNKLNGGPCRTKSQWLVSKDMRQAIKTRLQFVTERWGGSGTLFAWDLWNEIHPAHARNEVEQLKDFIDDIGGFLRKKETQLYGKSHLQTVSFYGASLLQNERIAWDAFHHPALDFATIHLYDVPAIDRPVSTIDAAIVCGQITTKIVSDITDDRPFFDTEHGPIYTFNNRRKTLNESFDDEYFTNMQWSHIASGGAGGGMRWPYRHPHVLTPGMRKAQFSLSRFVKLVNWKTFKRRPFDDKINVIDGQIVLFSCGDEKQSITWLLRTDNGMTTRKANKPAESKSCTLEVELPAGTYSIVYWNTSEGQVTFQKEITTSTNSIYLELPPFLKNIAFYIYNTTW